MRAANAIHPNVAIVQGDEFLPDRKEPHVLYLSRSTPGEPFAVVCNLTPERFQVLREFVDGGGHRILGYNAMRRGVMGG